MKILVITPDTPGLAVEPFLHFLREESYSFDCIKHPVAPRPGKRQSLLIRRTLRRESKHLSLVSYLIDFFLTILIALPRKYDLVICLSPHLTLAALLLRRLGRVRKVVYWALDYYPTRYGTGGFIGKNPLGQFLEKFYRKLEQLVVRSVDVRWTVTSTMLEGWKLGNYNWVGPVRKVPNTIRNVRSPLPWGERIQSIIWSGNFQEVGSLSLLTEAWPKVVTRRQELGLPPLGLTLTSRRPLNPENLPELFHMPGVDYRGFISSMKELEGLVRQHLAGLALYEDGTFKQYSDASRMKLYLSQGVPVIASGVPSLEEEIKNSQAGVVIPNSAKILSDAIILLCTERFNSSYSQQAYQLGLEYQASRVFPRELTYIEEELMNEDPSDKPN